jgi:hypothetical protein
MADPDRLIFIAANIDEANGVDETTPPPYPDTGGERVWYIAPDVCFDDPTKRVYKPGSKRVEDYQWREQWRGWPFIDYVLFEVDSAEFVLVMNQYILAKNLDGWVWVGIYSAETRTYKVHKAQMEEPKVGDFSNGPLYGEVLVGFSKILPTEYSI